MTETTPDGEPDHIGHLPWWRPKNLSRAFIPLDDFSCSVSHGTALYLIGQTAGAGLTLESSPKPAPVAELMSLTDDTPPSSMGLDGGVFVVFDH